MFKLLRRRSNEMYGWRTNDRNDKEGWVERRRRFPIEDKQDPIDEVNEAAEEPTRDEESVD